MSNLLIHAVAEGTAIIHAKRRSIGDTVDIAVTVNPGTDPLNTTTGKGVMNAISTAAPVKWDAARAYDGSGYASRDAQWRATRIGSAMGTYSDSSKVGSAGSPLYTDGINVDLVTLVDSGLMAGGVAAFRGVLIGLDDGAEPPKGELSGGGLGSARRLWFGRRISYLTAGAISGAALWDISGSDAVSSESVFYNTTVGQGGYTSAYKCGPFLNTNAGDPTRFGIECGHTNIDGSGHHWGNVVNEGYGGNGGPLIAPAGFTNVDSAYWDGATYDEVMLSEFRVGSDGHDYSSNRYWRRIVNSDGSVGSWYAGASHVQGSLSSDGKVFTTWGFTSKNHNRAIGNGANRYYDISEWGIFNAANPSSDGSDDPWGCLAQEAAAVPVVPQTPTLVSKTSSAATVAVPLVAANSTRSYIATLRPVIDGIDTAAQDYTLPVEKHFDVGPNNGNYNAPQVTITGLAAGAHTIAFKSINGAGTVVSSASSPLSVTI